ncbi:M23 family metallopeptidase [Streptomyces sp. TRM66268-LWL]|uniref:M23 family metallopeptidase n=1 Tax=Streptomyces polyasparticus TaxID=2767826 RepID=A0ABR7SJS8_9ACTN|nr:M23 family metallopeptidase [Streptomyces polyasparticus]MBC9714731.1 M23 family metallopeptidase [Streptomyces polyasparticus]
MLTSLRKRHGLYFAAGAVCIVVNSQGLGPLWYAGVLLLALGGLLRWDLWRRQRPPQGQEPVQVAVPVAGRWQALNGPATKIPSHTHSHAQTYAIDLIHRPHARTAPEPRRLWPFGRRPESYPAFGAPVLAPGDGVIVAAGHRQRDHLARTSLPGIVHLYLEGFVRSLGWPRHLWGNHLVLKLDQGTYAGFAHLKRGSLRVAVGDRVRSGRTLAECGNSGNTSEPHLHFQLMSGPDSELAHGVPFTWRYVDDDGAEHTGVPEDGTHFSAHATEAQRQV